MESQIILVKHSKNGSKGGSAMNRKVFCSQFGISFFLVLLLMTCTPVNRTEIAFNQLLRSQRDGNKRSCRVTEFKEISTWLFKSPIVVYKSSVYMPGFYPIAAVRGDSLYLISERSGFNRLIEIEPYNVNNGSIALLLVKEFLRFKFFSPDDTLLYIHSFAQLSNVWQRKDLEAELDKIMTAIGKSKSWLSDTGISDTRKTYLKSLIEDDEKRYSRINKILKEDVGPQEISKVRDGFKVSFTFCTFDKKYNEFALYNALYTVDHNGKLEGGMQFIISYGAHFVM